MENQNLNQAPTLNEMKQAGFVPRETNFSCDDFKPSGLPHFLQDDYTHCLDIDENLFVSIDDIGDTLLVARMGDKYKPIARLTFTKEAINKQFEHFGQPLPQWEKPKPKVGEVWKNEFYTFLIIKDEENNVLKLDGETLQDVDWINYETADYDNFKFDKFTKIADSLEDYYKEKFTK